MSRAALADRIDYCKRELQQLESMKTDCTTCERKKYQVNECLKHGPVPAEFIHYTTCPDWQISEIPF